MATEEWRESQVTTEKKTNFKISDTNKTKSQILCGEKFDRESRSSTESLLFLWTFVVFLILASTALLPTTAEPTDACETIGDLFYNRENVFLSQYKACLKTFRYRPKVAKKVLNTIWKTLVHIYPYTNIAIESPDPRIYSKTRLRMQLTRIKNTNYSNDFDFHKDLMSTISGLKDGHTQWVSKCFAGVATVLTVFPMVQVFNKTENRTVVKIAPLKVMDIFLNSPSFTPVFSGTAASLNVTSVRDFAGARVLRIDGQDVLDYVERRAKSVGGYRSLQARVNTLFMRSTYSMGSLYFGDMMAPTIMPENDTLTITVQRDGSNESEVLDVPYFVLYGNDRFRNGIQYYNLHCSYGTENLDASGKLLLKDSRFQESSRTSHEIPKKFPQKLNLHAFKVGNNVPKIERISADTDFLQVYMLEDGKTAVMTVPDFLGGSFFGNFVTLLDSLYTGYCTVRDSGATRLIIDVSNNDGGFTQSASFLTQLFFPNKDPDFFLQFKASKFAQKAYFQTISALYDPYIAYTYDSRQYVDKNDKPYKNPSQFFYPLVNVTQNNVTDLYSSLFKLRNVFNDSTTGFNLPKKPIFNATDILILTNGLCYSTCALFSYQMRQIHDVKFVSIGGQKESGPFQIGDGMGGFVVTDFDSFYNTNVFSLRLEKDPSSPSRLPVPGYLTFTISQSFGPKSTTIPQEFIYEEAQYKLDYTDDSVLNPEIAWIEASNFF